MNKALRPIAAIVPAALGYYLYQVQRSISGVKTSTITVIDNAPPVCVNSKAFATVNPCGYTGTHDSRTIVISPSPSRTSISDEQILSDLVRGVFGGWVFAPERWVLQALHRKLVGFSSEHQSLAGFLDFMVTLTLPHRAARIQRSGINLDLPATW